jgi:hypothetical protein
VKAEMTRAVASKEETTAATSLDCEHMQKLHKFECLISSPFIVITMLRNL